LRKRYISFLLFVSLFLCMFVSIPVSAATQTADMQLSADFSDEAVWKDWAIGTAKTAVDLKNKISWLDGTVLPNGYYGAGSFLRTTDGGMIFRWTDPAGTTTTYQSQMYMKPEMPATSGDVLYAFKMKHGPKTGGTTRQCLYIAGSSGQSFATVEIMNGVLRQALNTSVTYSSAQKDENGYFDLRFELCSESTQADWQYSIYSGTVELMNGTLSRSTYGDIAGLRVYNFADSAYNGNRETTNDISFKDIHIVYAGSDETILYNAGFSSAGEKVTVLDNVRNLEFGYQAMGYSGGTLFMACYGNGALLDVTQKTLQATGTISCTLCSGTEYVKVFAWKDGVLYPLTKEFTISYSEDYKPAPAPLVLSGEFYNEDGERITHMEGAEKITAQTQISADDNPMNVSVNLRLVRQNTEVFTKTLPAHFVDKKAEVSIGLENAVPKKGDELILTVFDDYTVYLTKKIGYQEPSTIVDILLVAGQSNALGQGGDATQSVKPAMGTVYYNVMGDTTLSTEGNIGWDSALGKTWHEETGRTVLIVKATWGGTGFPSLPGTSPQWGSDAYGYWNPGNSGNLAALPFDCYTKAKNMYAEAVASIDTEKYSIGRCVYFWCQGCNENNYYSAEQYKEAFLALHNDFKVVFGTEEARLTHGGILPIRSAYSSGFPNLKLTGPRIAQYHLAREREDLCIVSDATEHWYSDSSIAKWFAEQYAGREYPLGELPDSWDDIMQDDNVHYKQAPMNELGEQAAKNMLAYLEGTSVTKGIDLITPNGIQHYKDGDSIRLSVDGGIPVIPSAMGVRASFTVTGTAAAMDDYGVITPQPALQNDYAILTVTPERGKTMEFRLYSPLEDTSISIADIKDNKKAIYSLTTDDGYQYSNQWMDTQLQKYEGMRASMLLVPETMGKNGILTWKEAQALASTGRWDVVNHTKGHKQAAFLSLSKEELNEEINGGRAILQSYFPDEKLLCIATPGGQCNDTILELVKEQHLLKREASGGNNSLPMTKEELYSVKVQSVGAFATNSASAMNAWIDAGVAGREWIVEMWHGVGDTDAASWGGNVNAAEAEKHLQYVGNKVQDGTLWSATLDEVCVYTHERLQARLSLISKADSSFSFSLTDELEDSVFDEALTVNIALPEDWHAATVTQNGKTLESKVASGVLSVNVVPDTGVVSVTKQA